MRSRSTSTLRNISIHSLRMEGDPYLWQADHDHWNFNPLPPHGGRQKLRDRYPNGFEISIHSLRMEGDEQSEILMRIVEEISIHSLRMEGDSDKPTDTHPPKAFQSTPSAWRETVLGRIFFQCCVISIHSLRMEGDIRLRSNVKKHEISIHSLRMEGDMRRCRRSLPGFHFNPLPPHGGRLSSMVSIR